MSKRIICVWTANHVTFLHSMYTPDDTIISFDLDASALLDRTSIPYIDAYRFISMEEVSAFQAQANELAHTWYKPIESKCMIDGVSPLEMERRTLYTFFHNALCARLIGLRILDRYPSERLLIFDYPQDPIVFTDLHENATMPILRYQAEQRGMFVDVIVAPQTEATRIPTRAKRKLPQKVFNLLRNRWYWERQFWRMSWPQSSSTLIVLRINEGFRYAAIVDILRSRSEKRVMVGVVGGRGSAGLKLAHYNWGYPSFSLLPNHSYLRLKHHAKQWQMVWTRHQAEYQGDFTEIFANKYFDFQFRHLFQVRLVNTTLAFREARTIFKRLRTTHLMTSSILDLNIPGVIAAAKELDLHITTIPDSGIPTEPNLTYFGDSVIAWTNDYREVWKHSIKSKQLHIVGLHPSIIAHGYQQSTDTPPIDRTHKRVTLLMSTVQLSAISYLDIDAHRLTLRLLAQVPDHLQGRVELRFKLHPIYDFQHFYESLIPETSSVQVIRSRSIEEVIAESDLTLLVNINTSAHLLALAKSVPLLHIHTAPSWFRVYDRLDEWGRDFTVTHEADIWPTIERILFDNIHRQTVLAANRAYWEHLGANQSDPIANISAVLNQRLS